MSSAVHLQAQGPITVLQFDRPPVNALDTQLLNSLAEEVRRAETSGARALVLSGRVGMFSAGLDLFAMLALDPSAVRMAWAAFFKAARALAACELPIVAAIAGHAPAGGCVLALQCDRRIFADQGAKIGLNEVALGLPLPTPIRAAYDFVIGPRLASQHGALGTLFDPQTALSLGLVDELAPPQAVLDRALDSAHAYARLPALALRRTRREARAPMVAALDQADTNFMDGLIETWFSEETQAGFQAASKALRKPER